MCGIAGFLNPRNNDKKTEKEIYQILKKMNEVQRHRGPDDEGIFLENGFGFQRCLNKPTGRRLPARTLFRSAVISFPAEYAMHYLHCREFFSTCR